MSTWSRAMQGSGRKGRDLNHGSPERAMTRALAACHPVGAAHSLHPCNSRIRDSGRIGVAVMGGSPTNPGSIKTGGEHGAPPVVPSNPNSRLGRRARSPIRQGRVAMDIITVGIDVSKDRLDVAVRPSGEVFAAERKAAGLDQLITRLRELGPQLVALEATGGHATIGAG